MSSINQLLNSKSILLLRNKHSFLVQHQHLRFYLHQIETFSNVWCRERDIYSHYKFCWFRKANDFKMKTLVSSSPFSTLRPKCLNVNDTITILILALNNNSKQWSCVIHLSFPCEIFNDENGEWGWGMEMWSHNKASSCIMVDYLLKRLRANEQVDALCSSPLLLLLLLVCWNYN